jgi:WD40 repeat protein
MIAVRVLDYEVDLVNEDTRETLLKITLPNRDDVIHRQGFSFDNSLLYTQTEYGTVHVWRTDNAELVNKFMACVRFEFRPNSDDVAFITPTELRVVSLITGNFVWSTKLWSQNFVFTPDGSRLVCAHDVNKITMYDTHDMSVLATTVIASWDIEEMEVTKIGDYVLINSHIYNDPVLCILRTSDLSIVGKTDSEISDHYYRVMSGNSYYALSLGSPPYVYDIDTQTKSQIALPEDFGLWEFSEDERYAYGTMNGNTVRFDRLTDDVRVVYDRPTRITLPHSTVVLL